MFNTRRLLFIVVTAVAIALLAIGLPLTNMNLSTVSAQYYYYGSNTSSGSLSNGITNWDQALSCAANSYANVPAGTLIYADTGLTNQVGITPSNKQFLSCGAGKTAYVAVDSGVMVYVNASAVTFTAR
jgi:hypothetical protein